MRIVSLLPAATDIVAELGLSARLVGRTHECDWPPREVASVPVVTSADLDQDRLTSREISDAVGSSAHKGLPSWRGRARGRHRAARATNTPAGQGSRLRAADHDSGKRYGTRHTPGAPTRDPAGPHTVAGQRRIPTGFPRSHA